MHTIRQTEKSLWTVGFYGNGTFYPLYDFNEKHEAAAVASYLNGGALPDALKLKGK